METGQTYTFMESLQKIDNNIKFQFSIDFEIETAGEAILRFLLYEKEFSGFVLWRGQCIIRETN